MRTRITLTGLLVLLFASIAQAGGVAIDPGQWEMTTTMTMSMMPQPQTNTTSECIEESELNPEDFNMDEDNPCSINDVNIDGGTASWTINCPAANGMEMEGAWQFTSQGDSLSGKGNMSADMMGQTMRFDMTWEGKRIGDCE